MTNASGDESVREARRIVAELRELETWEQWALLDRRCAGRPDVRTLVRSELGLGGRAPAASGAAGRLIAAIDRPRGLRPATGAPPASPSASPDPESPAGGDPNPVRPDAIDGFRLLDVIGHGASGVVHRAEQAVPQRTVALKLLRATTSDDEIRRIHREADTLARLDHPGIARILAAGVLAAPGSVRGSAARAWLAMELVPGPVLDRRAFADPGQPPPDGPLPPDRARTAIECLARVADAVHHAHLNGVIHRDLKAANIRLDANGQPRVLDFGVARLVRGDAADPRPVPEAEPEREPARAVQAAVATVVDDVAPDAGATHSHTHTHTLSGDGRLVGTLRSMSPEQVTGDRNVDARTDIHAIGLLLYELLSGRLPYDLAGASPVGVAQRIRTAPRAPLGAARMGLPAELDVVLATALARDPDDRYASASALAADLRSVLEHRPISARPTGNLRRARLLLRRHRTAARIAAGLAIALVAATGFSLHFALDARASTRAAERQEEISRRAGAHMETLVGLLDGHAGHRGSGPANGVSADDDEAVVAILADFERRLDASGEWPEVTAGVRSALGRVLLSRGQLHAARTQLQAAADMQRSLGVTGPPLATTLIALANSMGPSGDLTAAEATLREAIEVRRQSLADGTWERRRAGLGDATVDGRKAIVGILTARGRWDEAAAFADELLAEAAPASDAEYRPLVYAGSLRQRALIASGQRDPDRAEALLDRASSITRRHVPPGHPMRIAMSIERSRIRSAASDPVGALALAAAASAEAMEHLEPASFDWMTALNHHVRCLHAADRQDEKLDLLRRAHDQIVEVHGPEHRVAEEIASLIARQ